MRLIILAALSFDLFFSAAHAVERIGFESGNSAYADVVSVRESAGRSIGRAPSFTTASIRTRRQFRVVVPVHPQRTGMESASPARAAGDDGSAVSAPNTIVMVVVPPPGFSAFDEQDNAYAAALARRIIEPDTGSVVRVEVWAETPASRGPEFSAVEQAASTPPAVQDIAPRTQVLAATDTGPPPIVDIVPSDNKPIGTGLQNPELLLWNYASTANSSASYQAYLGAYPEGRFADRARMRVSELANGAPVTEDVGAPKPDPVPVAVTAAEPQNAPGEQNVELALGDLAPPPPPVDGGAPGSAVAAEPTQPLPAPTLAGTAAPAPLQAPPAAVSPERAYGSTIEMVRHPTLDAPQEIVAGEEFTVSVALTEEQMTPEVTIKPGPDSEVTAEGALQFPMPAAAEAWPIDIDLLAAGFDLVGEGTLSQRVMLYRVGDSDFARFTLKARPIREASKSRQLIARLYHGGKFLGSVARPVMVFRDGTAMAAAEPPKVESTPRTQPVGFLTIPASSKDGPWQQLATEVRFNNDDPEEADLEVTIQYSDPDTLGDGTIYINSRHIGRPIVDSFTTPEGMNDWLDSEYMRLVDLGLKVRSAVPLNDESPRDPETQKRFTMKVAEGFGTELYRNYVPDAFKQVFWSLKKQGRLHSIQITSNSPVLPWELVRPEDEDGTPDGFLGINYRLARWTPRAEAGQLDRPLDEMAFTGVAAVAPAYDDNSELPFQKTEVEALSKLSGFRLVNGDFSSFEKLVGEVSTGFIHFSGHGEVNDLGTGSPVFAIKLLDQALDPTTWGALTFAPHDKGNPFFFFNACDTGRARSLGGFVQGWGPAILAKGASGFIGGMWPLTDRTAAAFSTSFYGDISEQMKGGPVYVAEVLQSVRKKFYETGDPTYLAYTFYGNTNLQVVNQ